MKKLAKKSLSMLLVFILALSACVSAIAYDTGSEDVTNFYASVNAYGLSPKLNWLHLLLDSRFTAFDEEAFAFTLEDSTGRLVADETMGHVETFTPAENDGFGFEVYFYFNNQSLPVLNAAESYTLTVPADIFTAGSEQNEQLIVTFEASEFINPAHRLPRLSGQNIQHTGPARDLCPVYRVNRVYLLYQCILCVSVILFCIKIQTHFSFEQGRPLPEQTALFYLLKPWKACIKTH
jgi:hypothetical protein